MCFRQKHCNFFGCQNKHFSKGYCELHYRRKLKNKPLDYSLQTTNKIIKFKKYATIEMYDINRNVIRYSKIDIEDIDKISKFKWGIQHKGKYDYPVNHRVGLLHRYILNLKKGDLKGEFEVDHINHDSSDNRKINLRIVSHSENMRNQKIRNNSKSGAKGVILHKFHKKWVVTFRIKSEYQSQFGYFKNKKEAITKRKELEKQYWGDVR